MRNNSPNMVLVRKFLELVVNGRDFDVWAAMLTEDVERWTPFVPPSLPTLTKGRNACVSAAREIFKSITTFRWLDLDLHETDEPDVIYGTCRSEVELVDGRGYANDYVLIFKLDRGRIREFREYMNPLPVMKAFAAELADGGWNS